MESGGYLSSPKAEREISFSPNQWNRRPENYRFFLRLNDRKLLEVGNIYIGYARWREDINFMFEWKEQYERARYCSCHENIKFISFEVTCNVLFIILDILMTPFLTIFRRFPNTFRRFSKNCPKVTRTLPKNFRELPKIAEDCGRLSRKIRGCFDYTPTNLSTI